MGKQWDDWSRYMNITLRKYPKILQKEDTPMARLALESIKKALDDTAKLPDGMERIALIRTVYFRNSRTIYGAAMMINISERTAKYWVKDFMTLCARYMGFIN